MKNVALVAAALLPLSLSLAACSGSAPTDLYGPSPSATDTTSGAAPGVPGSDLHSPAANPNAPPALVKHCNVSSSSMELCIENAQGHAGEVVDVDVFLLGSSACTEAFEASGRFSADASSFQLANPIQQVGCISRDFYGAPAPGTTEIMWNAFGGGAIQACPKNITPGKLDTVKIQILPGTAPGVYPITWTDSGVAAPATQCATFGTSGISGTIRVLP